MNVELKLKGVNQNAIQEMNRSLILHLLWEYTLCSRAKLAQLTGLKPATLSNVINSFIEWGIVKEEGSIDGKKGRRAIGIRLDTERYCIVAIRLSQKYFSVGLFDISGKEIEHDTHFYDGNTNTSKDVFDRIRQEIRRRIEENVPRKILAIGFAIPGPFIRKDGRIALMSEFTHWKDIFIKAELEAEFSIPVYLEHDAHVGAFAEYWHMSCNREIDLVYIAAGQGIGTGIITNGTLYKGGLGSAGEIGHTCVEVNGLQCECGSKGCLEKYCSSLALTAEVNKKLSAGADSILHPNCSFDEIVEAIQKGDHLARNEYMRTCEYLSVGVINIINLLNPHIIVIGDEMSRVDANLLLFIINKNVENHILPKIKEFTKIMINPTDSFLTGACIYTLEEIFKNPVVFQKK
ncbi:MAG: ROK family transcriptional regulator [Treponema sp.]|nr:ROK family transcriptional regulator [Treponema sp.]